MAGEDGSSQEEVQTLETERVDKDQIMDDADEGNKFVVVVNAKENRPMHNAYGKQSRRATILGVKKQKQPAATQRAPRTRTRGRLHNGLGHPASPE
eukprot:CAMPEP_0171508782 /NCGR_PEP_ID=MMETSP0958-20121227/14371_1 /TAXON_ID=87120 /ORGANISM="Aurantiochytrium limacinum, Strain ATCCMYA-1381" /LENGTH=95 /DNA_ID=CAMNT_0012045879 /DNA_START=69 /DNA_END=356 /DNA_ORIENTATION=+